MSGCYSCDKESAWYFIRLLLLCFVAQHRFGILLYDTLDFRQERTTDGRRIWRKIRQFLRRKWRWKLWRRCGRVQKLPVSIRSSYLLHPGLESLVARSLPASCQLWMTSWLGYRGDQCHWCCRRLSLVEVRRFVVSMRRNQQVFCRTDSSSEQNTVSLLLCRR